MVKDMKNPIGVHALVWVGGTTDDEIDLAIARTRAAGYDCLELSLHDLAHLDVERTRGALDEADLGVVCSRGLAFDADVSSDDPAVCARGADLLAESLRVSHSLGAKLFTGALYGALGKYSAPVTATGRSNAVAAIRDVAAEAERYGMGLGIEVCNRYETNVVNTARQALELTGDIGADNVKVHLDTYHMNIEEDDLIRPVLEVGDRLGYVHVGENHRGYLGSGHIDFTSFFHALADIDYQGGITFESFSSEVVAQGLSNDLAIWRNLWSDGAELAGHALGFITSGMLAADR